MCVCVGVGVGVGVGGWVGGWCVHVLLLPPRASRLRIYVGLHADLPRHGENF